MSRVVFLLEEYSMKVLLDELLPRLFPSRDFLCVPHDGKNDLERSIPRKLRAWREPGVQFVVVRDNDGGDCIQLKHALRQLCEDGHRPDTLIRIACQELESWYFGDPQAMAAAFDEPTLSTIRGKARFRETDRIVHPSRELASLAPVFQKVSGARAMGAKLTRETNDSPSFLAFVAGVERILST